MHVTDSEQNGSLSSQPVNTAPRLILHLQDLRKEPGFIVKAECQFARLLDFFFSKGQKLHCLFENVLRKKENSWNPSEIYS